MPYRMEIGTLIVLTRIHAVFEADTFFPEIDEVRWELVHEDFHPKDDRHKYDFTYQTFRRKST